MRNNNFFYSNVLNSVVFYCELVEKVKFLWIKQFCIQAMSKEFLDLFLCVCVWGGGGGEGMRRSQHFVSVKKKLHTAFRSVQFLASFISFYFEILSYLACGENIIKLASKNSMKLADKSTSNF